MFKEFLESSNNNTSNNNNNFSNLIKKNNNGSKNASMESPYDLEKSLKAKSIPFLNSMREDRSITGNFVKKSISNLKINEPI